MTWRKKKLPMNVQSPHSTARNEPSDLNVPKISMSLCWWVFLQIRIPSTVDKYKYNMELDLKKAKGTSILHAMKFCISQRFFESET